jgi:hypothetical protein
MAKAPTAPPIIRPFDGGRTVATVKRTARSAVTNVKYILAGIDGRIPMARRYPHIVAALSEGRVRSDRGVSV